MSDSDLLQRFGWWASLNHGGLLLAPSKIAEHFPETLPPLDRHLADRLRRELVRSQSGSTEDVSAFLDTLLEEVLGLHRARWLKGSAVGKEWSRPSLTRDIVRPARVWLDPNGGSLAVFYPDSSSGGLAAGKGFRFGVGRGKRSVSRVIEWMRRSGHKVALLASGRQLRLLHAGSDYDAFCEWDTDLWFQEGAPGLQVTALRVLLSTETLSPPKEGEAAPLVAAIQASRQGQSELSSALGERVRQAVETLIRESAEVLPAIDAEGLKDKGEGSFTAGAIAAIAAVSRRDIYIAATRVVLRCVVLLFAEAREGLLPRNNPIYEQSYGLQCAE